jgi:phosphopantothenoylcysteine decarboxylase/phosphopantothenate--cysteine ligase
VSDFEPETVMEQKVKRGKEEMVLRLKPTADIAQSLGKTKKQDQLLIGFALETTDEIQNARKKLEKKNLDLIVLNSLQDDGAGFGHDTNKISILDKNNNIEHFELKTKSEVAEDILLKVAEWIEKDS